MPRHFADTRTISFCVASLLFATAGCDAPAVSAEPASDKLAEAKNSEAKRPVKPVTDSKTAPKVLPEPEVQDPKAPGAKTPDPAHAKAKSGKLELRFAIRSDAKLRPARTTDGTILVHSAGRLARVDGDAVVDVPRSGRTDAMDERSVFLDHFGGRWPDAVFACWMAGMPNDPGHPVLLQFEGAKGWTKVPNGSGKKQWCYEGFSAGTSGELFSRKIAHDFETEKFALGPFITDKVKPGFVDVDGSSGVPNPKLSFVADWAVAEENEIWAVTAAHLLRLKPGAKHETFPLPLPVAQRSSEPLRVTYDHSTLYVHGHSRDGAYLARWKDDALESIEIPEALDAPDIADARTDEKGDLWILAGRILWDDVDRGTLWHRTAAGWEHVAKAESVTAFILDGDHLWVGAQGVRHGLGVEGVLLTSKPVKAALAWTSGP